MYCLLQRLTVWRRSRRVLPSLGLATTSYPFPSKYGRSPGPYVRTYGCQSSIRCWNNLLALPVSRTCKGVRRAWTFDGRVTRYLIRTNSRVRLIRSKVPCQCPTPCARRAPMYYSIHSSYVRRSESNSSGGRGFGPASMALVSNRASKTGGRNNSILNRSNDSCTA